MEGRKKEISAEKGVRKVQTKPTNRLTSGPILAGLVNKDSLQDKKQADAIAGKRVEVELNRYKWKKFLYVQ
jgi:hypothetical protein